MITVSIQKDIAQSTSEYLISAQSKDDQAADNDSEGALPGDYSTVEVDRKISKSVLNSSLVTGIIILYTFFALFLFVIKWNRAIKRMEAYLNDIGSGNFPDYPLKISGGDELTEMSEVINTMKVSLEERNRLRNELALASTIQAEMLPGEDAARQLPSSCRVCALMTPAREVGGDLYDFFLIDEDHLGLVIADVSDKGAPAALFMATTKMCIKENMMLGADPKTVLNRVNNRLLENNKSGLFVTAWIAEIDLRNGHMEYASAGHPHPFIKRTGDSEYTVLESDKNLVLAGLEDYGYQQSETVLEPGDRLFLYTDGLDEARELNGGFFGKQRIKNYLNEHFPDSIDSVVTGIKGAVDAFASGREQFDDLTILMMEYCGGNGNE